MSSVEPAVAVMNLLYSNWTIISPSKDTKTASSPDPKMVEHQILEKGWARSQRLCIVCGLKWEDEPGKPSPCGHVSGDNRIVLPKVPDNPPFTD